MKKGNAQRQSRNSGFVRLAQQIQAAPRAYGERDMLKLCMAVLSLADQVKALHQVVAERDARLIEARAELRVIASYANDEATPVGLRSTARAYQRVIAKIDATIGKSEQTTKP